MNDYPIISGDEYGLFHIDRRTGNVTVKGVLDREYYPKFTLQIEAYEAKNVDSYARININIKLSDENDNKPKFEHDHYNFELKEDELSPQRIVSKDEIKAYDEDFEVNIHYVLCILKLLFNYCALRTTFSS